MADQLVVLSPAESAVDEAIGEAEHQPGLPDAPGSLAPIEALEQAVLPALQRPPCLVMFSGGRDSSVILAAAARIARREQLPPPVPTTDVFPGYPETDETGWQELVLAHLGLTEHVRLTYAGEMNLLGPFVRESIRRHGLIAPAGAHLLVPALTEARGGSLLIGQGGDGLFSGGSFGDARAALGGRRRPTPRAALGVARGLAPGTLRQAIARRRLPPSPTWLRPRTLESLKRLRAGEDATEPLRWDSYVGWWARRRSVVAARQAVRKLAGSHDVRVDDPLLDPLFLTTIARRGGVLGWRSKTDTYRTLFAGVLPDAILQRTSKAVFTRPYWSNDAREFAHSWDGSGLPDDLVDPEELRAVWTRERPDSRSALLLHAAWGATLAADEIEQPFNCRLQ